MNKALILGNLIFTYINQPLGAPIVDQCRGYTADGSRWQGRAIHLSPWRKNEYGDRMEGKAFCIGRVNGRKPLAI